MPKGFFKYATEEERHAAVRASHRKHQATKRHLYLDKDIVEGLETRATDMESTLGFRPTIHQVLRLLLKREDR